MKKERKWYISFVNCDCSSHYEARLRPVPGLKYLRCQLCKAQVGPMQERDYGTVVAVSECEAIKKARAKK